jgi:hypothetical protein|tara:strand:+ start:799 stop:1008 length:210 start_codon:yes stop_codon:yes gene_type:complete
MRSFLEEIIYEQNKEFLENIATEMYDSEENRKLFIQKYHKKNFSVLIQVNKDQINSQKKKCNRLRSKKE